jgi:hypothetical protein
LIVRTGRLAIAGFQTTNKTRGSAAFVSFIVCSANIRKMKTSHVLFFVCGIAAMLGFRAVSGSNPSHHVYELRLYHVNEGKMDVLKARFGDHTDAIFKRHNMKSVGYWSPEDAPASQNRLSTSSSIQPSGGEESAAFQVDPNGSRRS